VKQCATPSPANAARPLQQRDSDALQKELTRHIEDDSTMSWFDIGLQFLDTAGMTYAGKRRDASFWIENASIEWTEQQAPFHTVARLTLLPKSQLSPQESAAIYFDVTANAIADSIPVGSINRAPWRAEAASRQARARTETVGASEAIRRCRVDLSHSTCQRHRPAIASPAMWRHAVVIM
jgi:hypothetical protein